MTERKHPSLKINIELMSRQAQRIHNWVQPRVGEMFFMMEVVYSQHPHMQEATAETQDIITRKLEQLDCRLQGKTSELQAQIQDDKTFFDSGTPQTITLSCTTPQSQCCAPLLIHFDQLILMYKQLWLRNLLTGQETINAIHEWTVTFSETFHESQRLFLQLQNNAKKKKKKT